MTSFRDPNAAAEAVLDELVTRGHTLVEGLSHEDLFNEGLMTSNAKRTLRVRSAAGVTVRSMFAAAVRERIGEILDQGGIEYVREDVPMTCMGCGRPGVQISFRAHHGKQASDYREVTYMFTAPAPSPPYPRHTTEPPLSDTVDDILDRIAKEPRPRVLERVAARVFMARVTVENLKHRVLTGKAPALTLRQNCSVEEGFDELAARIQQIEDALREARETDVRP